MVNKRIISILLSLEILLNSVSIVYADEEFNADINTKNNSNIENDLTEEETIKEETKKDEYDKNSNIDSKKVEKEIANQQIKETDIANIPCKNLRIIINSTLGKGESVSDPILKSDMEKIKSLNINENVSSLEGIEYAINLEELTVDNSQITQFSTINSLAKLKKLTMKNAIVESLDLSSLPILSALEINNCKNLSNINISGLSNLYSIHLRGLASLNSIDLSSNNGLRVLIAENCAITSLASSSKNAYMNGIEIVSCPIEDFSFFKNLTYINRIVLNDFEYKGYIFLKRFKRR